MNPLVIVALSLVLSAEVNGAELSVICPNGIQISAVFDSTPRSFRFWENLQLFDDHLYLFGRLHAKNNSRTLAVFSTANVLLSMEGEAPRRGYKKTIASDSIDSGGVGLLPNEDVEVDVYWSAQAQTDTLALWCNASRTANESGPEYR